jgi:hypothetical protein
VDSLGAPCWTIIKAPQIRDQKIGRNNAIVLPFVWLAVFTVSAVTVSRAALGLAFAQG